MGLLTTDKPKPLLKIANTTLLEHKLDALPKIISEVILIVGHKSELIRKQFKDTYKDKKIIYVEQGERGGTAYALWAAQAYLTGPFLVLMGDDLYSKQSLQLATEHIPSITGKKASVEDEGSRIITDNTGQLTDFVTKDTYISTHLDGGLVFTGLYALDLDIFNYEPVKMKTKNEWGLSHTLLTYAKDHPVKILETDWWLSVSTPNELKKAELLIR